MKKKKYCDVCGTEYRRGRKKRKIKQSEGKKTPFRNFFRQKRTIGLFALSVFVLIAVPSIVVPFALRAQYQGVLILQDINIVQDDLYEDYMEIVMRVSQGQVSISSIHLYSVDRLIHYQTKHLQMEYERYDYFVETFFIHKELPPLNEGIVLHIEFKYKDQWITYLF